MGSVVALGTAAGCAPVRSGAPQLLSVKGDLPKAWLQELPSPWQSQRLEGPEQLLSVVDRSALQEQGLSGAALLALGDGWAQQLDRARLQPLEASALLAQLAPMAQAPSRLFAPEGAVPVAFPWAFGTWLLVLRSRPDLWRQRQQGWSLLLDPSLRGKVVLPSSPRVVIELALRQLGLSSDDPQSLNAPALPKQVSALVDQALALDERDGLNLLLAGEAEAAVVPSHRAIPLLKKDPRLSAVLPESGSPLWWQVLLRLAPQDRALLDPPFPWSGFATASRCLCWIVCWRLVGCRRFPAISWSRCCGVGRSGYGRSCCPARPSCSAATAFRSSARLSAAAGRPSGINP